jgi:glycosyltransferase involved in cell wall biosynthesis
MSMCRITFARNGRVTVVLPTYNRADSLAHAIQSALDQTAAERCDIVVIDDGSTDQTPQVARRFGDSILYIRQPNAGVSAARNTAIRARPNEFVAFLDSDDEWRPSTIELQLRAMRRFPEVVLVTGRTICRRPDGTLADPEMPEVPLDQPFDLAPYLFERCIIQTPACLVRGKYLARTGLFYPDMRNCGDHELLVRLACQGSCVYLSDHLLVYSREDARRLTDDIDRAFSADLRARNRMRSALRSRPDCRPHWRRGTARTLQILRDHAFRTGRYARAARFGFHSLMASPWQRPRWEWGRMGSALLHSIFA